MIFGFSVVSLYYIIKMYNLIQYYTFNSSNSVFNKQSDLKKLDIFGLMGRISDPNVITQLSTIGHALLEKDESLTATFGYQTKGKTKHLRYTVLENANIKMTVSIEQENFVKDNVSLYKLSFQAGSEEATEFFTNEAYYIDWIGETLKEFDWVKTKKIEQKES